MIIYQEENSAMLQDIDRRHYLNFEYLPHIHASPEFIYVVKGCVEATIDGNVMSIPEDHFCVVLPWQVHSFVTLEYSRSVVLVTANRYVGGFMQNMSDRHGRTQVFRAENAVKELFMRHLYDGPFPDEYMISAVLLGLCSCFAQNCPMLPNEDRQKTTVLQRMLSYVAGHVHEELTLADVADALGYSYCYLSHVFSDSVGVSFRRFCNGMRIEHAQRRLEEGGSSMTEIAFDCGFATVRSFNRAFKEIVRMTPGEYQARYAAATEGVRVSRQEAMQQPDSGAGPGLLLHG